jgi:hypothetical protein
MGKLKFNKYYFLWAILLFAVEFIIAAYVHDRIIRPYIGDFLVVILVYCLVKSFLNFSVFTTALSVLMLSFFVETLQYFHFANLIGLRNSGFARIVLGTSFEWTDLLMYTAGIAVVIFLEKIIGSKTIIL